MKGVKFKRKRSRMLLCGPIIKNIGAKSHDETDSTIPLLDRGVVNQKQMFLLPKRNPARTDCLHKF